MVAEKMFGVSPLGALTQLPDLADGANTPFGSGSGILQGTVDSMLSAVSVFFWLFGFYVFGLVYTHKSQITKL